VDNKLGGSKSIAFVTFYNENDTLTMLLKSDRLEFKNQKLKHVMADNFKTAKLIEEMKR